MSYDDESREDLRKLILEELQGEFSDEIAIEFTRGFFTRSDGFLTKINLLTGKFCIDTEESPFGAINSDLIDICGSSVTSGDGTTEINLLDFVCLLGEDRKAGDNFDQVAPPIFFVATPKSDSPVSLTFQVDFDPVEPMINVFSWDPSGNPEGNVAFNWRCCLHVFERVG